jgi:predicted membrane protein
VKLSAGRTSNSYAVPTSSHVIIVSLLGSIGVLLIIKVIPDKSTIVTPINEMPNSLVSIAIKTPIVAMDNAVISSLLYPPTPYFSFRI